MYLTPQSILSILWTTGLQLHYLVHLIVISQCHWDVVPLKNLSNRDNRFRFLNPKPSEIIGIWRPTCICWSRGKATYLLFSLMFTKSHHTFKVGPCVDPLMIICHSVRPVGTINHHTFRSEWWPLLTEELLVIISDLDSPPEVGPFMSRYLLLMSQCLSTQNLLNGLRTVLLRWCGDYPESDRPCWAHWS